MIKFVSMSAFGRMGRFGNQLLQYAYLDMVARRNEAELRLPSWVGNDLFGLSALPPVRTREAFMEASLTCDGQVEPVDDELVLNKDFKGYAQYHTSYIVEEKDHIRDLFRPVPAVYAKLSQAEAKLKSMGPVIGVHLRRGDYGQSIFPIIPVEWYLKHLRQMDDKATLFIATEDDGLVDAFANEWPVVTAASLGVALDVAPMQNYNYEAHDLRNPNGFAGAMDFYPDFFLLSRCDHIVAPNSSFSFAAALLDTDLRSYWRASLEAGGFMEVDPWDDYPLLREKVDDYPHLSGISVETNPYWSV